jgi:hypothetical protein
MAAQIDHSEGVATKTFTFFSKLLPELQLKVWKCAANERKPEIVKVKLYPRRLSNGRTKFGLSSKQVPHAVSISRAVMIFLEPNALDNGYTGFWLSELIKCFPSVERVILLELQLPTISQPFSESSELPCIREWGLEITTEGRRRDDYWMFLGGLLKELHFT